MAGILTALLLALSWQAFHTGVTVDEPSHLLSSHLYWDGKDKLKPRDMPPLMKIMGGWVPRMTGPVPVPYDRPDVMKTDHEWVISMETVSRMTREQIERMFGFTRLPMLVFTLLAATLLWWWGRQLFSPAVGVMLAGVFALEPTALGHGAFFKNDLAATFAYLFFWYRAWRFWRQPSTAGAGWLGCALLLALLSKMSMLILVALAPALVLLRFLLPRVRLGAAAASLAVLLLIPYLGTLAAYQFETRRLSAETLAHISPNVPALFTAAGHIFRVLPVAVPMWDGAISLFDSNADSRAVYLNGEQRAGGDPLYFLVALGVKGAIPILLLFAMGLLLTAHAWTRGQFEVSELLWVLPGALYFLAASLSSLQLGIRLILPALPFGLLIAGRALQWTWRGHSRALVVVLFGWLFAGTASLYPETIAYFNEYAGGPENALQYLADSNIDWGQDLPELADYVHERRIPKIHVAYFGTNCIYSYLNEQELIPTSPPWGPGSVKSNRLKPEPGYWAVSANLLTGHFFAPEYRDYYAVFRQMRPTAYAGHSIHIYEVRP